MFSGPIGDRKRTKQAHNLKNYAEKTVVSLACSQPNCSNYEFMAGWRHTESFAPPLQVRLDGTTLKLSVNFVRVASIESSEELRVRVEKFEFKLSRINSLCSLELEIF